MWDMKLREGSLPALVPRQCYSCYNNTYTDIHYGEQNSNVEIPYQVIDNHVVFNIPGGSDNLENIMYPIENLDNVVEREINLNDM